jgi:hypothetical protein
MFSSLFLLAETPLEVPPESTDLFTTIFHSQVVALPVVALVLIVALVVLIVQWKLIRSLNMINDLLLYYGKQIEETRRIIGASPSTPARETPAESASRGMYEILKESESAEKPPPRKRKEKTDESD